MISTTLLIPAAGKGSRLEYGSAKCLYPINGKPLIGHILDGLAHLFDRTIVVVSQAHKSDIERYLLHFSLQHDIQTVVQPKPIGMADAIWRARDLITTPYVTVLWGDQILIRDHTVQKSLNLLADDHTCESELSIPLCKVQDPYVHYQLAEHQLLGIQQKREGDSTPGIGLKDSGLFSARTSSLFGILGNKSYQKLAIGKNTGESNFLQFIDIAAKDGCKINFFELEDINEQLGINTKEEALLVEGVLNERLISNQANEDEKRNIHIVLFSGGRGTSNILRCLINFENVDISLIINGYDDGASTGRIREFVGGMLGPSDFRKNIAHCLALSKQKNRLCLANLLELRLPLHTKTAALLRQCIQKVEGAEQVFDSKDKTWSNSFIELSNHVSLKDWNIFKDSIQAFFNYELEAEGRFDYADCAIGNIVIAGLFLLSGRNFNKAIEFLNSQLALPARIINVTDGQDLYLSAIKENGSILIDESAVVDAQDSSPVKEIFLSNTKYFLKEHYEDARDLNFSTTDLTEKTHEPRPNPQVLECIRKSNLIIYGPGTQHSSLFPSYLTQGISEEIANNKHAEKIFIGNVRTDYEIEGETANSLCEKLHYYLSRRGKLSLKPKSLVNRYFLQKSLADASNQLKFNPKTFYYEHDQLLIDDWEITRGRGKHRSGMILDELSQIVRKLGFKEAQQKQTDILSIIVPVLNEEKTIELVLQQLDQFSRSLENITTEIIVIDGGSSDDTLKLLKKYQVHTETTDIQIISFKEKQGRCDRGRGEALKLGLEKSRGDVIATYVGDNEYLISDLHELVNKALLEDSMFIGSRSIKGYNVWRDLNKIYRGNITQQLISFFGGRLITISLLLFSGALVADPLSNVRVAKRSTWGKINPHGKTLDFFTRMIKKSAKNEINIVEMPISYFPRNRKEGKKTNIFDGIMALLATIK